MIKKVKLSNELRDRLLKNSKLEETTMLEESIVFEKKDMITTIVPMINVALSGKFDGGLLPGATMIAGVSKNFKSLFGLLLVASFQAKYPDGIVIFYNSEFGSPQQYFKNLGINADLVIHTPVSTVEELTHDIVNQLNGIKRGDHVMILIDSVGNLASEFELAIAEKGKDTRDMTRAKGIKALFRMIVPKVNMKSIPLVAINHTYKTQEKFSKDVTGGGTGPIYGANDIWIIGRRTEKEGEKEAKHLVGFDFIINIWKSRTVKENSKIPITVSFEQGIQKWSGLLDLAIEAGVIDNSTQGWYNYGEVKNRRDQIENNSSFWKMVLESSNLIQYIENKYRLPDAIIMEDKVEELNEAETE